jgi:hypothetical protein
MLASGMQGLQAYTHTEKVSEERIKPSADSAAMKHSDSGQWGYKIPISKNALAGKSEPC